MKESTTLTTKGQVTIPKEIREALGLKPGDKVVFEKEGNKVVLKNPKTLLDFRGYVKAEKRVSIEDARTIVRRKIGKKVKGELKR